MIVVDEKIRTLQRAIHSLESSIDAARGSMNASAKKKWSLERRLAEVESVYSRARGAVADDAYDCRMAQQECAQRLEEATSGLAAETRAIDSLYAARESNFDSDAAGSEIIRCLSSEIERCRREIEAASSEYSQACAREQQAVSSRQRYVRSARDLAAQDEATVCVWESTRY